MSQKDFTGNQKAFKRKQVLIDKQFQLKFILRAILPILFILILTLSVFLILLSNLESSFHFESTNDLIAMLSDRLGSKFNTSAELFGSLRGYLYLTVLGMAVGAGLYVGYIFLYFSHRIAGPILRFEKALREIHDGNLDVQIQLREKDEFKQTAQTFNEMAETMSDRVKRIRQLNEYTLETIRDMKKNSSEENRPLFEKLEDLNKGIQESIEQFRVKEEE